MIPRSEWGEPGAEPRVTPKRPLADDAAESSRNRSLQMLNSQQFFSSKMNSATIIRKKLAYEREDVQKKTFAKWINSQLSKGNHAPITDLFYDLRDGTRLLSLLEVLTEKKYKREKGKMRVHHLNNVARALSLLQEQNVKLVNISNEHIVDGSPKITLGLVWAIILHWQVQGVLKDVMSELQQTNLEKTLLAWCRQTTQSYQGVDVRNFTTSWRDGLAFCALLHRHRPDLFEWPVMAKKHPYARLDNAFRIAHENLGIERLLDPEDVNTQNPDKKSLMMYVMCLFQALPHSSISMDCSASVQSDSSFSLESPDKERPMSAMSIGLGTYQQTLEEVLTWLLGAEDRLAGMPPIADTTKDVKEQFHELEDLMLELTDRQGNIGEVLGEGSRLLREDQMGEEESEEVRMQMKLLSTRWEELRVKAMDRQTRLHEQLMKLQQEELDTLKQWLTKTEDRIANMSELGPTFSDLEAQVSAHQALQDDLEAEQENINSLSNMVVVVDESSSDATYSSLEDELNALGERWAHICKWAEQRWTTLQNLQTHWSEFDGEMQRSEAWLGEKEKLLREMERNPTEDKQEMVDQAVLLQALQSEMEQEASRQNALQEKSSLVLQNLPQESSARERIPLVLETMQDRLDILSSIFEAQTQRLLNNGIDISKIVCSGDDGATAQITTETGTIVTKTTTRTIVTESTEGATAKRQKISGRSQEEFIAGVLALGTWMEGIESRLKPSSSFSLSALEMEQLHQEVEKELEEQKEEYTKVLSLGQSATSETATIGESTVENEIKLTSMKTRWANLEKMLKNLKTRIKFDSEVGSLNSELDRMGEDYPELEQWVNHIQSTTDFDSTVVADQMLVCAEKKFLITKTEEELASKEKDAHCLPSLWPEEKDEVIRKVQALKLDFKNLFLRISNWEFILSEKAKWFSQPEADQQETKDEEPMEVTEGGRLEGSRAPDGELQERFDELSDWLARVEQQLAACPSMAPLPKMEEGLINFKVMLEEVDKERLKLGVVNRTLEDSQSTLVSQVEELNSRWDSIVEALTNKVAEIEKGIERQRQFEEEASGLRSWLGEVEAFLEAEDAAIGDVETLQAQLEQSNALEDDILSLQSNVTNIRVTGAHFQSAGDPELRDSVKTQLEDLNARWNSAVSKATLQNTNLKEALEKSQKVWKDGEAISAWLDSAEPRVPPTTAIETTSELNSVCSQLKELQDELKENEGTFNELNQLGKDMISLEKVQPCSELTHMFGELNERWSTIANQINSKYESVTQSKENYETFKRLCSEEGKWLDDLEEKLEKSNVKLTDAEEISETLYDLDNYLQGHPDGLQEAQKLGDLLTKEGLMSVAVQNAIHNLTSRYDALTAKASDQQHRLEGGVEEALDSEREYVKVLEDLSSSQHVLHQFPLPNQLSKIQKQLDTHREVLHKMEQRVELYLSQGKAQAAQRLQDQLSHLVTKYKEVEEKVKLTQQSKDFDDKLVQLSLQLSDIDEKSRAFDIESSSSEYLEGQLSGCMELYRSLSLVKSDVEGVIATGRKIVKEGMTPDPENLTLQLDQLKAMYNQLGGSVTELRGRLEAGVKHSKKAEKESSQLEEWLSVTEKELDLREASLPIKNYQQELEFAQHAFDDVIRKKPVLASLKDSLSGLSALFGNDVTAGLRERVQDQTLTWDRVHTRLANRVANLKVEHDGREKEMEKFILRIGEIQAWLEKTEKDLGQIENFPMPDREKLLQTVSTEVQEFKKRLNEIKDSSEEFVACGTLFESRLEPELSKIKRRLDRIASTVTVKEFDQCKTLETEATIGQAMEHSREDALGSSPDREQTQRSQLEAPASPEEEHEFGGTLTSLPTLQMEQKTDPLIGSSSNGSDDVSSTNAEELTELKNANYKGLKQAESPIESSPISWKSESPSGRKLGLVEIEEIKTTISHLSFEVPTSSSTSTSPTTTVLTQEEAVSQGKKFRKKYNEKKRNIVEVETEPENLDDVIAGLKKVAEKDDSALIEKARRKSQFKEESKEEKERLSLFKPSKREDDDLESLTSVDTDMAPMSENSRDLECTYSDLESISESVSSKGDPLLSMTKEQTSSTATWDTPRSDKDSKKLKTEFDSNAHNDLYSNTSEDHKGSLVTSTDTSTETLPVEKLQAMIAELDAVLSSDDSSSDEDADETDPSSRSPNLSHFNPGIQSSSFASDREENTSDYTSHKRNEREYASTQRDDRELASPKRDESEYPTSRRDELEYTSLKRDEREFMSKRGECKYTSPRRDECELPASKRNLNPIEFKYQAVHVAGEIEFARANTSIQEGYEESLSATRRAKISMPIVEQDSVIKSQDVTVIPADGSESLEAKRVSIQSSETSDIIRGVTMELKRSKILSCPEEATLVTLESYPGSEESLASDLKGSEGSGGGAPPSIPKTKSVERVDANPFDEVVSKEQWIKTAEDRLLEIFPERKEAAKEEKPEDKEENVDSYLKDVSVMVDKLSVIQDKGDKPPKYSEAKMAAEEFELEVCQLEPDVATLISKGDTLTLMTHMSDVPKANAIGVAVNNLRKCWGDVKERGEVLKKEAATVSTEAKEAPIKAQNLVKWLDEVSKKLDLANNDEKQLKKLEQEIDEKKSDVENLNSVGELLKKYKLEEVQPMLTLINIRWSEIKVHLAQYQKVGLNQKSIEGSTADEDTDDVAVVPDFLANVNRLRESISHISRQMNSRTLAGKGYENLMGKEEELNGIKKELERLKPKVDSVETERLNKIKRANQAQTDQMRRVIDKLREEWAQVNRGYTEKHERWVHNSETWRCLQKTIEDFSLWLNGIEDKLSFTSNQPRTEAKATQKELEKQVTLKHRPSQTLQTLTKEVTEDLPVEDARRLQDRVDDLLKRWRALLLDLAARRERIAKEDGSKGEGVNTQFEALVKWVDQGQTLMEAAVNLTDEAAVSAHVAIVKNHLAEMESKTKTLQQIKESEDPNITVSQMKNLETGFNKVSKCLPEYKDKMETKENVIHTLVVDADDLHKWAEDLRVKLALRDMTPDEARKVRDLLLEKGAIYETLDNTYWALSQDAEGKGLPICEELKSRMNSIESRLKNLETQFSTNELMTSLTQRTPTVSPTVMTSSTSPMVCKVTSSSAVATEVASLQTGTTVTTSVTNVIQNVVKLEESVTKEGDGALPAPFPKPPDASSPTLILAALDKSILQIRDWLTLMQQMSSQQIAVVGDADVIRRLIEKQKSVLRELESKKPQLDELVASADSLKDEGARTQLHQQVTKLREHWDETNSSVLGRKTQLDAMLNDTHKFESKRVELETWLSRMESRLERMSPVARTPDHLDQQIREQKAFHAEVHQYKHHIELFTQTTGRLVTIYQNDDTRRLKKASDSINQRFSNLNSSIISRGKSLYAAMNSTHNLSKALEKFISWLSEAESTAGAIEMEADKVPHSAGAGRRDSANPRTPFLHLKDLQSEIESHKDVLASLNATGQKLLGTLENQDEALLLHRRLGEMNHRWNTLKYKSIAIRNRLEGTAENWNSLLLSLRELIEWVIRKDTELTGLGPLLGDVNLLAKYEGDLAVFRRGLDEKQPVIESNLKSGRQLIASEPPLSDTSDSEAGRDVDGDVRYRGEESTRDLTRSVRREVTKLSEKWAALWERAANLAAQVSMAHKKLGVLQKTVEDVGSRLGEAEKEVGGWGPMPQDPNLADQSVHNIRKFRETLPDLQRGIDDVNDQAARFSAHNVPLSPANSAALHDLNNRWKNLETSVNDRWRQVAGRSREVTPLTPAQLASSVSPPWERATATNKVPYYINHAQETTHWDHPQMMDLLDSLSEFNHIKFSAYRTATKLRSLQKKLSLDRAKLQLVTDVFDEHGLRGQNDRLIDVNDMVIVLSTLYGRIASDNSDVNTTLATDLCLNWLLNVYDSQRTGQMRVLSFRVGLISLCRGHLEEKYRYMFRLIADPNRMVDQRKLGLLLHDCVQVPRQLGEVAAFGGSNIEPSVRSCFTKAGKDRETIEAVHFLTWVQQEPQSLVWLAVLHRVAASESVQHQVKCNICKTYPIVGLRYRCLKCLSFDMCQRCFFEGRSSKSHKITHPMHEYCTATTAGDEMKDFTKALKNKFKSKRSLQKHTKKGYLPVQTVLEGDPLESPSPSPSHNVSSQDMHSRLELYASRLAEVELRTNSNSTPDSEDEHGLIAQYCQSLSSSDAPYPVPKSPLQIMASVDADQKDELEQMIRDLEEENRALQAEYERLKSEQPSGTVLDEGLGQRSEAEMLAEAKLLREHKGRLEARMSILEDHNRQLEAQLQRLRQLLVEQQSGIGSPNKSGTLQTKSVTASQLAMDSPAKINGHSSQGGSGSAYEGLDQMSEYIRPPPPPVGSIAHMGNLFSRAGDLEKAVGSLVASMNQEKESDSHSDDAEGNKSDENDYDNTVPVAKSN